MLVFHLHKFMKELDAIQIILLLTIYFVLIGLVLTTANHQLILDKQ